MSVCKTVTVPGPEEENGDNGDDGGNGGNGDNGEEPTPRELLDRATKYLRENPLVGAGIVGAGILLVARPGEETNTGGYVPYQPRPADKDKDRSNR